MDLSENEILTADDTSDDNVGIQGVTEVRMSERDFRSKMKELIPGASEKAIERLMVFAEELDKDGHPKEIVLSETYVSFILTMRQYGGEITGEVLKLCEDSCLNYWEIRDAARHIKEGVSPEEVLQKALDGELDLVSEEWDELQAELAAQMNGALGVPSRLRKRK